MPIEQFREKDKTMAKKTEVTVTLVDDLTGKEFQEGEGETVKFTVDGQRYELDLESKNAATFRKAFEKYTSKARKVGANSRGSNAAPATEAAQIRAWAVLAGKTVNDRGRIPQSIVDEYRASKHSGHTDTPSDK
jgi:hypothetical protein